MCDGQSEPDPFRDEPVLSYRLWAQMMTGLWVNVATAETEEEVRNVSGHFSYASSMMVIVGDGKPDA